ncbi:MAG: hypothetical protein ACPG4Z_02630 [Chitinophagales bacterium]
MIDVITILNAAQSVGSTLASVYSFLTKQSNTSNIHKKMVFRELRDNLKRLENRNKKNVKLEKVIASLDNSAIKKGFEEGFDFNNLTGSKKNIVTIDIVFKKRNKRYLGWNAEKLIDSIDSKIVELKDLISYYDKLEDSNNNFPLKLSNLYYQILLLVILVNESKK